MSRYLQFIAILILLTFVGCSVKEKPSINIGEKSFDTEDYMTLSALDFTSSKNYASAINIYEKLYAKSNKFNYLEEAIKIAYLSDETKKTAILLQKGLSRYPNNEEVLRIKISFLARQKKYEEAKIEVEHLLKVAKSERNLKIAGTILLQIKEYNLSLKYFESAYKIHTDAQTLLNIVDILYNYVDRKNEAISYLETHIRMKTCEYKTCFKLIEIYGKERNIQGIISTYKRLYSRYKNDAFAKKVLELLVYIKDKSGAIKFLEQSGYEQDKLLNIYLSAADFKNAFKISKKLYTRTGNVDYLGKMAIYEYEQNKNKMTSKVLKSVSDKFERVVYTLPNPLYLNYYGYLLIDHDLDVEKGLGLVKEALLKEPNSPFYLDSLAWGYYKQNNCLEAKKIMEQFMGNTKEKEVLMHYNKIIKCLKK